MPVTLYAISTASSVMGKTADMAVTVDTVRSCRCAHVYVKLISPSAIILKMLCLCMTCFTDSVILPDSVRKGIRPG